MHFYMEYQRKKFLMKFLKGKSMSLNFQEHRFIASSIVGGGIPIGLGIALAIKMKKQKNKVYIFVGDMTFETGVFYECYKYAKNFNIPIKFIVEDNGLSTNTPTKKLGKLFQKNQKILFIINISENSLTTEQGHYYFNEKKLKYKKELIRKKMLSSKK